MTKSTLIELPEHQAKFVEGQLSEGIYGSASELMQAALRLLEQQEAQRSTLRQALIEGEQSPAKPFDPDALLARLHAEHKRSI